MNQQTTLLEKLGNLISLAGNAIMMNLLFLVSCLPIVTMGQAWCALLSAVRYNIRGEKWFTGFKVGFKTRFWRGILSWTVMLIPNVYMLLDVHYAFAKGYMVQLIASSFIFALMSMVTMALLMLNVYIPTSVGNWINNATAMVFRAPLQLLGAAALFWFPVVLGLLWFAQFYYLAIIFVAFYFVVAAFVVTVLLKNVLLQYLGEARQNGTLLAEEGRYADAKDNEEEEEEE